MNIVKATEPIIVEHPVWTIFGPPGVGKTSLGYSAASPLLLDADDGAHRAVNRRDTLLVPTWGAIVELMAHTEALAPYETVVVDTVGRILDKMSVAIVNENPKWTRGGGELSLQGYGILKTRFRTWIAALRALGKDVVLLAHESEEKDGDLLISRPDVIGGSYDEIMKISDFIGYLSISGKHRQLDFSPTDKHPGKNPARWEPIILPPIEQATNALAGLIIKGRQALGAMSEESAKVVSEVEMWRRYVGGLTTASEFNTAVHQAQAHPLTLAPQTKKILKDRAEALGLVWDKKAKAFSSPELVDAD